MTQYQRCLAWIKKHIGRCTKARRAAIWEGWNAALSWMGNCKDCRHIKPKHDGCTALFRLEPCHMWEPKEGA